MTDAKNVPTISDQLADLFENGLLNFIGMMPDNISYPRRIAIEGMIYAAYGAFDSHRKLETLFRKTTSIDGSFSGDRKVNFEAFHYAWAMVDYLHSLRQMASLTEAKPLFSFSTEMASILANASLARNYGDHLVGSFGNITKAKNWAPLFGWMTYQFTPHLADVSQNTDIFYSIGLSSTSLKEKFAYNAAQVSKQAVSGVIDNICVFIKDRPGLNLSFAIKNLAIELNALSIRLAQVLFLENQNAAETGNINAGLIRGDAHLTLKADTHEIVRYEDLAEELDRNKIRITASFDQEDANR